MKLYNEFLINLINTKRLAYIKKMKRLTYIKPGVEFDHENVFSHEWDDCCEISYDDYIENQNDEAFLKDIETLNSKDVNFGLRIKNVTELSEEGVNQVKGKLRIYIFDPEEERMSGNSFFYASEYAEARKRLDSLISQIDLSNSNKLQIAKQIFTLLRKQYTHDVPQTGNYLDDLRYCQNMYGCLCLQKAVCAGGANSFRALCSLANIKCRKLDIKIYYKSGGSVGHSLNQICVNGEWGIVDVELFKEVKPDDTSLFFCDFDTYKSVWEKKGHKIEVDSHSTDLMPTNISVTREYIDSLDDGSNHILTLEHVVRVALENATSTEITDASAEVNKKIEKDPKML